MCHRLLCIYGVLIDFEQVIVSGLFISSIIVN